MKFFGRNEDAINDWRLDIEDKNLNLSLRAIKESAPFNHDFRN